MRVVGRKDDIVFQAEVGKILRGDLIAFHRTPALPLKIFQRIEFNFRMFRGARELCVFATARTAIVNSSGSMTFSLRGEIDNVPGFNG